MAVPEVTQALVGLSPAGIWNTPWTGPWLPELRPNVGATSPLSFQYCA
ncbi:hypothetical protein [Streptomyces umbrinus]